MNQYFDQLQIIAFSKTYPFCYSCYQRASSGKCKHCGSDDLMREMPGVGVEYGLDWVIKEMLKEALTPANLEQTFIESVEDCYPATVNVGWLEVDTVRTIKELDPVSWRIALQEYEDHEADEGNIVSFDNGAIYYWSYEVEQFISNNSACCPIERTSKAT